MNVHIVQPDTQSIKITNLPKYITSTELCQFLKLNKYPVISCTKIEIMDSNDFLIEFKDNATASEQYPFIKKTIFMEPRINLKFREREQEFLDLEMAKKQKTTLDFTRPWILHPHYYI